MLWSRLNEEPNGQINIVFRRNSEGRTYMARQFWKIPLQILKPHYYDIDGTAVVYSLNPAGGILQHDRLLTEIECEPDTDAVFTTPGNSKYYRMDEGCAKVWNRIYVHEGAVMEYLPEHNVPFAGSTVYQENEFRVEKGAVLFAADMVTSGRKARGEEFDFNRYSSRTRIYIDGRLALCDNCRIEPDREDMLKTGVLDGHQINGSFYVYADDMDPDLRDRINEIDTNVTLAAGNLRDDLLVVRFLGSSIIDMAKAMHMIWNECRQSILNKPALRLRKEFSGCSE